MPQTQSPEEGKPKARTYPMASDEDARVLLGDALYTRVRSTRVLVVGAGGIGCA